MKRKTLLLSFGMVASAMIAAAFVSTPKRTPFEKGYGLDPIAELVAWQGTTRVVIREFGSAEDFDRVAARLDRTISRHRVIKSDLRVWTPPDGTVTLGAEPMMFIPVERVPKGTRTFMQTTSAPPLNFLQKFALKFGKRI